MASDSPTQVTPRNAPRTAPPLADSPRVGASPTDGAGIDPQSLLVPFLKDQTYPCPRCGYDLRGITRAVCPECSEPLVLKVGTPRARFGWLILAMAPGCFSGVMAVFVFFVLSVNLWFGNTPGRGIPYAFFGADAFGFASAASVVVMYVHRHRIMSWRPRRQATFAAYIWGAHVVAFVLFVVGMILL